MLSFFPSNSLTLLGKRSSDADKAVAMLNQCQEQMLTLEDSKPLEVTLDGAKQAVVKYAGSYILEFNELRSHLDDGCEVLQQVLATGKKELQFIRENVYEIIMFLSRRSWTSNKTECWTA